MKKQFYLSVMLLFCLILAGCGGEQSTSVPAVPSAAASATTMSAAATPVRAGATAAAAEAPTVAAPMADAVDACKLISKEDAVQALSGEIGDAQGLNTDGAGVHASTCDYASGGTDGKHVSISIRQLAAPDKAQTMFQFTTAGAAGQDVPGIGDGAFWDTTKVQLVAVKGSVFFFMSVGGTASNMDATMALAKKVVDRLP